MSSTCEPGDTNGNGNGNGFTPRPKVTICTQEEHDRFLKLREEGFSNAQIVVEMGWRSSAPFYAYLDQFKPKSDKPEKVEEARQVSRINQHFGLDSEILPPVPKRKLPSYEQLTQENEALRRKLIEYVLAQEPK